MRVCLDNCCFNRPFDNQKYITIQLESEAKLFVQKLIEDKKLELIWSFILDYENDDNPFIERRERIAEWRKLAVIDIDYSDELLGEAYKLLEIGLKEKDALHVASAIIAKGDVFLTTDKKILNKEIRKISVMNPIDFIRRLDNYE